MLCKYNIITMKDFFYAIQDLFVDVLFLPLDGLRELELENWWAANFVSWIFIVIGIVAFIVSGILAALISMENKFTGNS